MLCQPTKATCDNYCKQYHGGDKAHGDSAYGTVMGTDCDCHCSPGYVADDTLTCVKANNCKDECLKKMGEGAIATGSYPNCNCDCDKGYTKVYDFENGFKLVCKKIVCPKNSTFDKEKGECVCDEGFYPTPKDGACIKKINNESCGNGHCDTEPKEGAVIEDCEFCPQDCKCGANQVCNVNHPDRTIANWGCISSYAKVIEIGCDNGNKIPTVMLRRAGQDNDTEVGVGVLLNEGDQLTLAGVGKSLSGEAGICTRPYVTLQWGDTKARMFLGSDNPMGSITIKKDAVESGWPSTAEQAGHEAWSAWEILSPLIESTTLHVLHFFTSPDTIAEPDLVRVYAESHILINQSGSGIHIYTLDGGPVVEYKGQNTTVEKGMAVIVNTSGVSTPTNFTASDVGDWYLRVPEQLGGNATAEQSGITLPDFGSIISEFKNTCCGSTAMILGMFLLGAWGSRRVYEKRGERNV